MRGIPGNKKDLIAFAQRLLEASKASQGIRSAAYRQYYQWLETGRQSGSLSTANLLYAHIDRLHSNLFSPIDLRFAVDYENHYGDKELAMATMTGRLLTREWERRNIDQVFALGVKEALTYGTCIIKMLCNGDGESDPVLSARLVMPWQFGVENENKETIEDQDFVCETAYMTKSEVWRRIAHLPDADKLYQRIIAGKSDTSDGQPTSWFHQVLSTMAIDTSTTGASNVPGGLVQLTNSPSYGTVSPQIGIDLFPMHELWVKDDDLNDWVTIQFFEPDVLICPLFARKNLLAPGCLPYRVIRPNEVAGYFWGRSELVDLMVLQNKLTVTLDDVARIMGQQFDKLLFFTGDGLNDEWYAQSRSQGWGNMGPNANVTDMTPKMPAEAFKYIEMIMGLMDKVSGFPPIMSGQGESGVRAGVHANTLVKTGSPRLRDRSLAAERQCASFADLTLDVLEAKDAKKYWTDQDRTESGEFLLSQIPEDRRVIVDSHSSSPIFMDDHMQELLLLAKAGAVGPDTLIEESTLQNKDLLLERLKKMQAAAAAAKQKEDAQEMQETALKHGGK